jgi:hypothetical protein
MLVRRQEAGMRIQNKLLTNLFFVVLFLFLVFVGVVLVLRILGWFG